MIFFLLFWRRKKFIAQNIPHIFTKFTFGASSWNINLQISLSLWKSFSYSPRYSLNMVSWLWCGAQSYANFNFSLLYYWGLWAVAPSSRGQWETPLARFLVLKMVTAIEISIYGNMHVINVIVTLGWKGNLWLNCNIKCNDMCHLTHNEACNFKDLLL